MPWEISPSDQHETDAVKEKLKALVRHLRTKVGRVESNDPNKKSLNDSVDALEDLSEAFENIIDSITPEE